MIVNYQTYQKQEVSDGCRGYIVAAVRIAIVTTAVAVFLWGVIKWACVYW